MQHGQAFRSRDCNAAFYQQRPGVGAACLHRAARQHCRWWVRRCKLFRSRGPAEGSAKHTIEYKGATWRFANSENLALFKEDPERYAPAYGGYCAWAISQGTLTKGDPKYWSVRDGRLYLNYSKSVHDQWLEDPEGFILQANEKWPKILE
ncbi:YHS domain-containing (seleno)protein [Marinobacter sp. AC-23]|uniref:YHS domain-containing (seleno)protein n=1 Tax=Marinobacter sp. AC-23 TaxID=1879031 RepID=UPI0026759BD8|nr:YHS domain-containing (seleno)protein [Marinobacter sp. AC-23]